MTATAAAPTIGGTIDALWELREQKRELEAKVKEIEKKITDLTPIMFEIMDAQGTDKGAGRKGSLSIGESIQADTVDWIEFMKFVAAGKRNDKGAYLHLVQRRVSVEAYRELLALGIKVPGLVPYTKRVLNIRSL